jgi:hypothetical protein
MHQRPTDLEGNLCQQPHPHLARRAATLVVAGLAITNQAHPVGRLRQAPQHSLLSTLSIFRLRLNQSLKRPTSLF